MPVLVLLQIRPQQPSARHPFLAPIVGTIASESWVAVEMHSLASLQQPSEYRLQVILILPDEKMINLLMPKEQIPHPTSEYQTEILPG
jgi:hypothetical protein